MWMQNKRLDDILPADETVYLRENSNISTGGDSLDFTDDILQDYNAFAVKSAQAVNAKICGVDLIIQDIQGKPAGPALNLLYNGF